MHSASIDDTLTMVQARGYKYEALRYVIKFGIVTNHRRIVVEVSTDHVIL